MISDQKVEAALTFLAKDEELEEIVRDARLAESLLKHIEAVLMKEHSDLAVSAQTREARASPRYLDALQRDAEAHARLVAYKGKREAAAHFIEVWRSQNANARTSTRIG